MRVVMVESAESQALYGFAAGRGWELERTGSAVQALAAARERRPDVVLFAVWVTGAADATEVGGPPDLVGVAALHIELHQAGGRSCWSRVDR